MICQLIYKKCECDVMFVMYYIEIICDFSVD